MAKPNQRPPVVVRATWHATEMKSMLHDPSCE
jgi:hypothetical protein